MRCRACASWSSRPRRRLSRWPRHGARWRSTLNEYRAGTVAYTSVITEQTLLLADEQAALAMQQSRLVASVALIEALGGGWDAGQMVSADELQKGLPFLTKPP